MVELQVNHDLTKRLFAYREAGAYSRYVDIYPDVAERIFDPDDPKNDRLLAAQYLFRSIENVTGRPVGDWTKQFDGQAVIGMLIYDERGLNVLTIDVVDVTKSDAGETLLLLVLRKQGTPREALCGGNVDSDARRAAEGKPPTKPIEAAVDECQQEMGVAVNASPSRTDDIPGIDHLGLCAITPGPRGRTDQVTYAQIVLDPNGEEVHTEAGSDAEAVLRIPLVQLIEELVDGRTLFAGQEHILPVALLALSDRLNVATEYSERHAADPRYAAIARDLDRVRPQLELLANRTQLAAAASQRKRVSAPDALARVAENPDLYFAGPAPSADHEPFVETCHVLQQTIDALALTGTARRISEARTI